MRSLNIRAYIVKHYKKECQKSKYYKHLFQMFQYRRFECTKGHFLCVSYEIFFIYLMVKLIKWKMNFTTE
jgi:hypothetical protein